MPEDVGPVYEEEVAIADKPTEILNPLANLTLPSLARELFDLEAEARSISETIKDIRTEMFNRLLGNTKSTPLPIQVGNSRMGIVIQRKTRTTKKWAPDHQLMRLFTDEETLRYVETVTEQRVNTKKLEGDMEALRDLAARFDPYLRVTPTEYLEVKGLDDALAFLKTQEVAQ